jgi:hypothetical protein
MRQGDVVLDLNMGRGKPPGVLFDVQNKSKHRANGVSHCGRMP